MALDDTTSVDAYLESAHDFVVEGVRFPVVLAMPSRAGHDAWRILLIAGSQHADVDGNVPAHGRFDPVYADLARRLAAHGHIVMRYAKHGPQTGTTIVDAVKASAHEHFRTRITVAAAASALLEKLAPPFAARRTAVAGHSEGSIVSTFLAARRPNEVGALVCLAGPARRLLDNMREQLQTRLGLSGDAQLPQFDLVATTLRAGQPLSTALFAHEETRLLTPIASDQARARYIREVDEIDPSAELRHVPQPTLVVQGDADAVVGPWHAELLRAAREELSLPVTLVRLPGLSHFYQQASTSEGSSPNNGGVDLRVAAAIDIWLRSIPNSQAASGPD